jgi:hypothetical protein
METDMLRKSQQAIEGLNPFSQAISAGDNLIHAAGQNFGSGTINEGYQDIFSPLEKRFRARQYEKEIRGRTGNDTLNQSFMANMGDHINNVDQSSEDNFNRYQANETNNDYSLARGISDNTTEQLLKSYNNQLQQLRSKPGQRISPRTLYTMRRMHNELNRRGVDTSIFNADKKYNAKRMSWETENQIRKSQERHHGMHEDMDEFIRRTNDFTVPGTEGHPELTEPPAAPAAAPAAAAPARAGAPVNVEAGVAERDRVQREGPTRAAQQGEVVRFRADNGAEHLEHLMPGGSIREQIAAFLNENPGYNYNGLMGNNNEEGRQAQWEAQALADQRARQDNQALAAGQEAARRRRAAEAIDDRRNIPFGPRMPRAAAAVPPAAAAAPAAPPPPAIPPNAADLPPFGNDFWNNGNIRPENVMNRLMPPDVIPRMSLMDATEANIALTNYLAGNNADGQHYRDITPEIRNSHDYRLALQQREAIGNRFLALRNRDERQDRINRAAARRARAARGAPAAPGVPAGGGAADVAAYLAFDAGGGGARRT